MTGDRLPNCQHRRAVSISDLATGEVYLLDRGDPASRLNFAASEAEPYRIVPKTD